MKINVIRKYSLKNSHIVKSLVLISIILSSAQIITTPIGGLSIFQIFVSFTGIVGCIVMIQNGKIRKGSYLLFVGLTFLSSIMAFILSTNKGWGKSFLLLGILQAILILLICNFFELGDLNDLLKAIIRSQYITLPLSLYSIYKFYFGGGIPSRISLGAGFFIDLGNDFLLRAQAAGQIRLSLPFATPPVLSVVMAMMIIILLYNKELYKRTTIIILLSGFFAVMLLTGSRTGMVAFVMALAIGEVLSMKGISLKSVKKQYVLFIGVGVVAVVFLIYFFSGSEYFTKLVNRFVLKNIMEDRHLLVPLDGIIIWLSSAKNFIFGIGFGSSSDMMGKHTYLPPYFLNSFVTYIVERGIMGMVMVFQILRLLRFKRYIGKEYSKAFKSIYICFLVSLFSAVFYETFNCYIIIFVFAIMFMCSQSFTYGEVGKNNGEFVGNNSDL